MKKNQILSPLKLKFSLIIKLSQETAKQNCNCRRIYKESAKRVESVFG
jgi:hypothetical protein